MTDNPTRAKEIVDAYFGCTFKGSSSFVDRRCIELFCEHVLSLAPNPAPVANEDKRLGDEMNEREKARTVILKALEKHRKKTNLQLVLPREFAEGLLDELVAALAARTTKE